MSNKGQKTHMFKKDRFSKNRGGNSQFLNIFCSACGAHIALYQKDGPGKLLRMYLDRIFEPSSLATLQNTAGGKKDLPNMQCPSCNVVIGTPMVYEEESRLAFRLTRGTFAKKNSDGNYPPEEAVPKPEATKETSMTRTVNSPDMDEIVRKARKSPKEVKSFLQLVKRSMEPLQKRIDVVESGAKRFYSVERRGVGVLKTVYGKFWHYNFAIDDQWEKYSVLVKGDINPDKLIPIFMQQDHLVLRTDSGCETGQLFGDITCECCEQLKLAMQKLSEIGEGMIISIPRQDGRGMGLTFKLATLWIQDELNVHTVESASLLAPGGVIDIRTYAGVICILKFFEVPTDCVINLATNNPEKVRVFGENGYKVADDLVPVIVAPTEHTEEHLRAKEKHLHHNLTAKKGTNS